MFVISMHPTFRADLKRLKRDTESGKIASELARQCPAGHGGRL